MSNNVGDMFRFGNPLVDPVTGVALAAPPTAFTTNGAAADPTTVTLTVKRPDGTIATYGYPSPGSAGTLTREAVGRFYADILLDQPGGWVYELAGTGAVATVEQGSVRVERRRAE